MYSCWIVAALGPLSLRERVRVRGHRHDGMRTWSLPTALTPTLSQRERGS
jgi:hypothetical protein